MRPIFSACTWISRFVTTPSCRQSAGPTGPHPAKSYGLIVDYLGIFDDVAQALVFDETSIRTVITNLDELKSQLAPFMEACLAWFPGVDRKQAGWEGLLAAQQCLPDNERRDAFAADFSRLAIVWEAVSPDPVLTPLEDNYRWLAQVYEFAEAPVGQREAALACARGEDHRSHSLQRERAGRARRS